MSKSGCVTEQDYIDAAKELGVEIVNEPIEPGDLYLAGRNTGIKFLTCAKVDSRHWINSTDPYGYPYDTWECKKVREIK